jgi:O-antigen/teichoic acid export membrane protein
MNSFLLGLYQRVAWRTGLDIFSRGLFLLVNLLIARALSLSEFGHLAYALSFAQVFYTFTDLGTSAQIMKELGEFRERANLWVYYFKLRLLFTAASAVVFIPFPWLFWRWEQPWLMYLVLLVVFGNSLLDFSQFVCNGLGRMDLARRTLVIQRGLGIGGIVIPLILHPTLAGVVVGMTIGSAAGTVFSMLALKRGSVKSWATPNTVLEWKRILPLALPNAVSSAFGMWYLRLAPILLGWMVSSRELGEYGGAFRIFEATYIIPAAVMGIGLPHLSAALKENFDAYKRELSRLAWLMVPGGVAWAAAVWVGSPWIIRLLLGDRFAGAAPVMKVLGIAGGLVFLNYFVTYLMFVADGQRRHALHQVLVFLFSLSAHLTLIPRYGGVGAAWALVVTEIFLFTLTAVYVTGWHKRKELECA